MSGGHYDYLTFRIRELADHVAGDAIRLSKDCTDELGWESKAEPPEILSAIEECAQGLSAIGDFSHALEWYLSGDYGPEQLIAAHEKYREYLKGNL